MRLNQAPVEPPAERMGGVSPNPALWRKNIGKRTTFRLVNTRWAFKYGEKQFLVRAATLRSAAYLTCMVSFRLQLCTLPQHLVGVGRDRRREGRGTKTSL